MGPKRRRRHPLLRALVLGVAAAYAFALGVYGAVAIPVSRTIGLDFEAPVGRFVPPTSNYHVGLRVLCLVAGFAGALLLARAAAGYRSRGERLELRAF